MLTFHDLPSNALSREYVGQIKKAGIVSEMAWDIGRWWNIRTFTNDCTWLIKCSGKSHIQGCIVTSSFVDLLGSKCREQLSNEVGDIWFGGEGKYSAFEGICDRQKYILENISINICWTNPPIKHTPFTVFLSKVTVGLSTMNLPSMTGVKTSVW